MTRLDAPDLAALGIAITAAELEATAAEESAITRERAGRTRAPHTRRRAGPLPQPERAEAVAMAVLRLREILLGLTCAVGTVPEITNALACAGLALKAFPPSGDDLADRLAGSLNGPPTKKL